MLGPFGLGPKMTIRRRALPAARALAARGHTVTLLLPPWHTPDMAGRAWDDAPGVRVVLVSLAGLRLPVVGHLVVAARMARLARALRPDVVLACKPKAYGGLALTLLWWLRRARLGPSAALVVDSDDWEGPGGWNDLERYSRLQRAFFAWQERWGLSHADQVTVASRALEGLVWALGVPPARVTYLPNAVDDSAAAGEEAASPATEAVPEADRGDRVGSATATRPPSLLLYTRFFEFDLARPLDVIARLRARLPGARLVVAGAGLFGEERRFAALAAERGLADAVDVRGWVDAAGAAAALAASDAALYPFDDTLVNRTKSPFKLLELMAAGLPVVADAVGELREVIVDGASGRLVPPGDAAAMADAAAEVLADPALRARLADGARARIAAGYRWSAMAPALEAVFVAALRVRAATAARARSVVHRP